MKIIISGILLGLFSWSLLSLLPPVATQTEDTPTTARSGKWITGYYSAANGIEPIADIPWTKYTHISHFAAAPGVLGGIGNGTVQLHYLTREEIVQMVSAGHRAGKKVLVAIKDNDSFVSAFGHDTAPGLIAKFVSSIASFVNTNGYDGVDIDWEKEINVAQYEDLLTRLRNALPTKTITIAAGNWGGLESVASTSYSEVDQINLMCYDMDSAGAHYSWHNHALTQAANVMLTACDWRAKPFTNAGVPAAKIGIGIPFYGRRWVGVTQPLVSGNFSTYPVRYRDLVTDDLRWRGEYRFYDRTYKSDYLSIPPLQEFVSYSGVRSIKDSVAWQKSQGFGGIMTFAQEYEYLPAQTGDDRYPLSTTVCQEVFGTCP